MDDFSNELLSDFLSLAMFTLWALFTTLLPGCCCSVMLTALDGCIMARRMSRERLPKCRSVAEAIYAAVLRTTHDYPVHPAPQTAKPASRSPAGRAFATPYRCLAALFRLGAVVVDGGQGLVYSFCTLSQIGHPPAVDGPEPATRERGREGGSRGCFLEAGWYYAWVAEGGSAAGSRGCCHPTVSPNGLLAPRGLLAFTYISAATLLTWRLHHRDTEGAGLQSAFPFFYVLFVVRWGNC